MSPAPRHADAGGAPLPGARCTVLADDERYLSDVTADRAGAYRLELPPGTYRLRMPASFRPSPPSEQRVTVTSGAIIHLDREQELDVPDRGPCCKPYGAPPARRRVV